MRKQRRSLLDDDFNWVDGYGRILDQGARSRHCQPPLGDESRPRRPIVHRYGDVATVMVERDKIFVLRIWVQARRPAGALLVYHEVSQNVPAVAARARPQGMGQSCYTLPYEPRNARRARLPRLLAARWRSR